MSFKSDLEEWVARQLRTVRNPDRHAENTRRLLRGADIARLSASESNGRPPERLESEAPLRESIVPFAPLRGLIGIPNADDGPWGIPFTAANAPLGTTLTHGYDQCQFDNGLDPNYSENPKRESRIPALDAGVYQTAVRNEGWENGEHIIGEPDGVVGGEDGMQYADVSWIGSTPAGWYPGQQIPPDLIVLSWRSYASRYGDVPPNAPRLYYRGRVLCGLPAGVNASTFLGAAVADFGSGQQLVAAVSCVVDGRKLSASALNWVEQWSAYRFGKPIHDCDGDAGLAHHLHYPIRFYRRKWDADPSAYPNEDPYDQATNPNGWALIAEVECQSFTPTNYERAYQTTRPLGGVHFSPDGTNAACTFVDEWTDPNVTTGSKNVHNITGYLTWSISENDVTQTAEHVNPEFGITNNWDRSTCSGTDFPGWSNPCGDGPPFDPGEMDCTAPVSEEQSRSASQITSNRAGSSNTYDPKIVAVDYDRGGNLVTATITGIEEGSSYSTDDSNISHNQTLNRRYICDAGEVDYIDQMDSTLIEDYQSTAINNSGQRQKWVFTVSGVSGFELTLYEVAKGRLRTNTKVQNSEVYTCAWGASEDCADCGENPYQEITGSKVESEREEIWDGYGTGKYKAAWFWALDLRFGKALYLEYDRNSAIIDTFDGSGSWSSNAFVGSQTTVRSYERHARLYCKVIENGQEQELASGVVEDLGSVPDPEMSSGPWSPPTWSLESGVCPGGSGYDNSTTGTTISWGIEYRTGIDGFFHIDAYVEDGVNWTFENLYANWGACDEHGNHLVGCAPHIKVVNYGNVEATYSLTDIGEHSWITYLSGQDYETVFQIGGKVNTEVSGHGLI